MKSFIKTILYQPLLNLLIFIVWLIPGHNVGIAIIVLTLLIRLILLPSSNKATEAQKKIQEIQPELDKIKEKYKNDQQAQAKATMEFYQVNKINPLSSCLPLLIQFPILIVLYYVFRYGLDTSHFDLLYSFVPRPEFMNTNFFGINITQPNIYLAILTGLAQFWQSKQLMPKKSTVTTSDKSGQFQKILTSQMTYIMPLFTVFIAMALPAALSLYWTVTSLFSVAQQYYVLKRPSKPEKVKITIRQKE
ncbi:MAG: YidC/Oxa1 family membrane protein insertase [Patescibacteria group bacterium]|nr:YidC/Oxa1 family membrane protein insertase [Patescibacteria group bacterium]